MWLNLVFFSEFVQKMGLLSFWFLVRSLQIVNVFYINLNPILKYLSTRFDRSDVSLAKTCFLPRIRDAIFLAKRRKGSKQQDLHWSSFRQKMCHHKIDLKNALAKKKSPRFTILKLPDLNWYLKLFYRTTSRMALVFSSCSFFISFTLSGRNLSLANWTKKWWSLTR